MLSNIFNILLVLTGFTLVIVVHELGHFLVARWAGVRVLAFAVGFGPALFSFRRGLGLRIGSSEPEYFARAKSALETARQLDLHADDVRIAPQAAMSKAPAALPGISPTEYRLNVFPFGGYVKMLGQDDTDASAVSSASDSYTVKPIPKRMAIISAGVIMNVILAALLFNIVFLVGMKDLAPIIGAVEPGSPAAIAGLRPGDTIVSIDGEPIRTFTDLHIASAMAAPDSALRFVVDRPGGRPGEQAFGQITLEITPRRNPETNFLEIGALPAVSGTLLDLSPDASAKDKARFAELADQAGLTGVEPGWTLTAVNGGPILGGSGQSDSRSTSLLLAAAASDGRPFRASFARPSGGAEVEVTIQPVPDYSALWETVGNARYLAFNLAGLAPAMAVEDPGEGGMKAGLQRGDIFARIGDVAWPDGPSGIREIRSHAGKSIDLHVIRAGKLVELTATVSSDGRIGFVQEPLFGQNIVSPLRDGFLSRDAQTPAALSFPPELVPGTRVESVNGHAVRDFPTLFAALLDATRSAQGPIELTLGVAPPTTDGVPEAPTQSIVWKLEPSQYLPLRSVCWRPPPELDQLLQSASVLIKAHGPWEATMMGVQRTRQVLANTYLTFARLFQGTVKVEHLSGPVGIADAGRRYAAEGIIYLLFFLGLISANLAVVNFLPIPIADGGQMVMLCIEGITRKPVPIAVQNIVVIAGLALVGSLFLLVTANDLMRIFR